VLERFELDRRGIREVLRSPEMHQMVNEAAAGIQQRVRAKLPPATPVRVERYSTDRGAAAVVIADPRGMSWQARDGVLTRSAGELGIEVRGWQR
jgi:hypothetical protein